MENTDTVLASIKRECDGVQEFQTFYYRMAAAIEACYHAAEIQDNDTTPERNEVDWSVLRAMLSDARDAHIQIQSALTPVFALANQAASATCIGQE